MLVRWDFEQWLECPPLFRRCVREKTDLGDGDGSACLEKISHALGRALGSLAGAVMVRLEKLRERTEARLW